jgi:membrane-associated protein
VNTAEKFQALTSSLGSLLNPTELIRTVGLVGIWAIIFAETGLLVGFFFPGDSLLFLAGVAASDVANQIPGLGGLHLPIGWLLIVTPICAVAGAQLGHWLGHRYGPKLFARPNSRLFKQEYVDRAEQVFNRFGPAKAIVLARFIPIVRTFMNPVAGVLRVPAGKFFVWNLVGGIIWSDGILLAGYYLANQILKVIPADKIDLYILPAIVVIILISLIPIFIEILRARRDRRRAAADQAETVSPGANNAAE